MVQRSTDASGRTQALSTLPKVGVSAWGFLLAVSKYSAHQKLDFQGLKWNLNYLNIVLCVKSNDLLKRGQICGENQSFLLDQLMWKKQTNFRAY